MTQSETGAAARSTFLEYFGREVEVIAQAPGRVNLIGEHIDYNDGFVLPFAIDAVTTVAIARRGDDTIQIVSSQMPAAKVITNIEAVDRKEGEGWARYILGVIWSLKIRSGLDIYIDGRVPLGAGLSSSAALECSVATALNHLFDLKFSLPDLARLTQRAENEYVGVPCGIMDQSISLMGKKGHALLLDCVDLSSEDIPVDFEGAGLKLLIIDTRAHHALIDGGYAERRASCEAAREILGITSYRELTLEALNEARNALGETTFKRVRHVVTEIARVEDAVTSLRLGDFQKLGELLNDSHFSLRDDYTVSCPELDCAVEIAQREGALGARMVGGGFGGSAIALIRLEDLGRVSNAIEKAFAQKGFVTPRFFDSLPSDGAKVLYI